MIHILCFGFGGDGWGEKAPPDSARVGPCGGGSGFVKSRMNVEFDGGVEMITGFAREERSC